MHIPTEMRQLEGEMKELGLDVKLTHSQFGIIVEADNLVDRLVAKKELRDRGCIINEPTSQKTK